MVARCNYETGIDLGNNGNSIVISVTMVIALIGVNMKTLWSLSITMVTVVIRVTMVTVLIWIAMATVRLLSLAMLFNIKCNYGNGMGFLFRILCLKRRSTEWRRIELKKKDDEKRKDKKNSRS